MFGQLYGWERPNWFAPEGVEPRDEWSFRRTNYFEHVGNECRHVHEKVGLLDMSAFAKCFVTGPGASSWLDGLVANRIPPVPSPRHSFGVTAAGGAGWGLAEWIVEGEPTIDMMGVDPRRFGPYASRGFLKTKNEEAYRNVFVVHFPDEERTDARPLKQSPCYDRMKARGAVFGQLYGWERPNWFAPEGVEPKDEWSFRRTNYFEHVGNECRHVHEKVGLLDMSAFAKCFVTGPGAEQWLDGIVANRLPKKVGRIGLCHMLSKNGGVRSEFTIYRNAPDEFYLVSAGAYERHDHDYLLKAMPRDGSVQVFTATTQWGVLVLAGPKSRDLLQKITDCDLSNKNFPWLTGRFIDVGIAQAHAIRVNFVGELGWELHHPIEMQNYIFDLLFEAGEEFDLKPFGIRIFYVWHERHVHVHDLNFSLSGSYGDSAITLAG